MNKKLLLMTAVIFALVVSLIGPATVAASPPEMVKVLIGFDRQPSSDEAAIVRGAGGSIKHTYHLVPAIAASIPEAAIQGLLRNPRVTRVEPDITVYAIDTELDNSWGVKHIGAGTVHDGGNKGTGVKIAIIDSGIDYNHLDLDDNYAGGYDFFNDDADPMDVDGHGTHVAGIIAAEDNEFGVVGVAPGAELYALKALEGGTGYYSDVIAAVQWAVDNGIQVTNNSYGSPGDPGVTVKEAFDNAYAAGVVHIAAAGNEGNPPGRGDNVIYPARWNSVIAVAATDESNKRARWSSTGLDVELSAPGVNINSTLPGGVFGGMSGTSMASPHVAGTAALVLANGTLTDENGDATINNIDLRLLLQRTADPLGNSWLYGYGLVDAYEAAPPTGNIPPVAHAGSDQTVTDLDGNGLEAVTLDASASYDLDGTITAYKWAENGELLSTEVSFTGSFSVGTHTINLSVTDNEGATSTDEVIINVTEVAIYPTVTVSIDMSTESRQAGPNIFTTAVATVTIVDTNNDPVEGATVYGHWSELTGDTDFGVTDINGLVILKSDRVKNASGSFTFTVDSVTKGEITYELSGEISDSKEAP